MRIFLGNAPFGVTDDALRGDVIESQSRTLGDESVPRLVEDVIHPQRPREGVYVRSDPLGVHPTASFGWEDVLPSHVSQDDWEGFFVYRDDTILTARRFYTSPYVSSF